MLIIQHYTAGYYMYM